MEICRKFLGKLCTIQNEEIMKDGNQPLFNKSDFLELVNEWTMVECALITSKITMDVLDAISNGLEVEDDFIMPWCVMYENDCDVCQYALRHGQCSDQSSDYRKLFGEDKEFIFDRGNIKTRVLELIQTYHSKGATS